MSFMVHNGSQWLIIVHLRPTYIHLCLRYHFCPSHFLQIYAAYLTSFALLSRIIAAADSILFTRLDIKKPHCFATRFLPYKNQEISSLYCLAFLFIMPESHTNLTLPINQLYIQFP